MYKHLLRGRDSIIKLSAMHVVELRYYLEHINSSDRLSIWRAIRSYIVTDLRDTVYELTDRYFDSGEERTIDMTAPASLVKWILDSSDQVQVITEDTIDQYFICYKWEAVFDYVQLPKKGSGRKNPRIYSAVKTEVTGHNRTQAEFSLTEMIKKKSRATLKAIHSVKPTGVVFAFPTADPATSVPSSQLHLIPLTKAV